MTRGRFAAAALAGMVAVAVFGGLFYGVLFAGLFEAEVNTIPGVMKDPPDLLWIALAHVPFGVLLALVVSWRGEMSARGGAITGAMLGLLMAASYNLSQYGTTHLWSLTLTLVEPLIAMALVAAAGAVVGTVLGEGRPAPPDMSS